MSSLDNLSIIATERQTAGRGQGSHCWCSEPGKNLTFSMVMRFGRLQASECRVISHVVALGVRDYLQEKGIEPRIKLPNDIWVGKKKICGILIENILDGKTVAATVAGIGLNVNQEEWPPELPNPVSMRQLSGTCYDIREELPQLADHIVRRYLEAGTSTGKTELEKEFNTNSFEMKLVIPFGMPSEWHLIDCLNWEKDFPYKPEVKFRVWHDGKLFYIEYYVNEETTKAEQTVLGGPVYTDSCVECFIQPGDGPIYYNFEWNAAGKLAMAARTGRNDPEDAPLEVLESVETEPSLGHGAFAETALGKPWTLKVAIPCSALFKDGIDSWNGKKMRMNLYKCGDGLKKMHFVTWAPVGTSKPDYHRPEFFVEAEFEQA